LNKVKSKLHAEEYLTGENLRGFKIL